VQALLGVIQYIRYRRHFPLRFLQVLAFVYKLAFFVLCFHNMRRIYGKLLHHIRRNNMACRVCFVTVHAGNFFAFLLKAQLFLLIYKFSCYLFFELYAHSAGLRGVRSLHPKRQSQLCIILHRVTMLVPVI